MADYKMSVSTDADEDSAVDPSGFSIRHHRSGSARLEMSLPTGGHFLHAAVGMCIFNDALALAKERNIEIDRLHARSTEDSRETLTTHPPGSSTT